MKVLLLTLLAVTPVAAQSDTTLTRRLDSIAGHWVDRGLAIGIVAAVVKDGDILLHEAYGRADVEWDVPMPLDAMFEIGSATKQFTAVAVLQLRDESNAPRATGRAVRLCVGSDIGSEPYLE